jgi:hypothetical protein
VEAGKPLRCDGLGAYPPHSNPNSRGLGPRGRELCTWVDRLPDTFLTLWGILRWALAFLAVTVAHAVLYYLAPDADLPFK